VDGGSHPQLAQDMSRLSGIPMVDPQLKTFLSTESYCNYEESVRGACLAIIQTAIQSDGISINDRLNQVGLMSDAAIRSDADKKVITFWPLFPYARQDRMTGRDPVSADWAVDLLAMSGVGHIVTMDIHSRQTQGHFRNPFDNLTAIPLIEDWIAKHMEGEQYRSLIVSPDTGRAKVAEKIAGRLGLDFVVMIKSRDHDDPSQVSVNGVTGDVRGMTCYLNDDMIDSG